LNLNSTSLKFKKSCFEIAKSENDAVYYYRIFNYTIITNNNPLLNFHESTKLNIIAYFSSIKITKPPTLKIFANLTNLCSKSMVFTVFTKKTRVLYLSYLEFANSNKTHSINYFTSLKLLKTYNCKYFYQFCQVKNF